jgi:hypothetical protein
MNASSEGLFAAHGAHVELVHSSNNTFRCAPGSINEYCLNVSFPAFWSEPRPEEIVMFIDVPGVMPRLSNVNSCDCPLLSDAIGLVLEYPPGETCIITLNDVTTFVLPRLVIVALGATVKLPVPVNE